MAKKRKPQPKLQPNNSDITMELERITPTQAKQYLGTQERNRPLSRSNMARMVRAFRAGAFNSTADPIKFDDQGRLIDGQHRLMAIIQTGISCDMYVARGLHPETFWGLDQGKRRNLADNLAADHHQNYQVLATAVRVAYHLLVYRQQGERKGADFTMLRADLPHTLTMPFLEKHKGLHQSVRKALSNDCRMVMPQGYGAGLHYCCAYRSSVGLSDDFWLPVWHGEYLERGTPGYELRKRYLDNKQHKEQKLTRDVVVILGVKGWNTWVKDETWSGHITKQDRKAEILRA